MGKEKWHKYAIAAACIVSVVVIGTVLIYLHNGNTDNTGNTGNTNNQSNNRILQNESNEVQGITIPAMELPDSDNAMGDMIGLIVYDGKVYTEAEHMECDQATMESLTGEYLGKTRRTIDEWSSQSEYGKELASNVPGEVYTVKGYDNNFRICIPWENEGSYFISFYENLNGITLVTGKDLYDSRLHLKENYAEVTYQLHDDWNDNENNFKKPDTLSKVDLDMFIDAMYQSSFVEIPDNHDWSNSKQAYVYFTLKDGTSVEIRLFENGYVHYQSMFGKCFIHISDDIFQKVFTACLS